MSCIFEKSKLYHGPLSHITARTKLTCTVIFNIFLLTASVNYPVELAAYAIIFIFILIFSKIPILSFLKKSLILIPLAIFIFLTYKNGSDNQSYNLTSITFLNDNQFIYIPLFIFIKGSISLLSILLIAITTDFDQILKALKSYKIPDILIFLIMISYYYIDFFIDTLREKILAWKARKYSAGIKQKIKALSEGLSSLFVNTYKRENNIFMAGKARRFIGKIDFMFEDFKCAGDCHKSIYFIFVLIAIKCGLLVFYLF